MRFEGKTIVVTGAGGGIGRQLVLKLLGKGASVAAVDINAAALEDTRRQAGAEAEAGRITLHRADITDRAAVARLPKEIKAVHGRIDGLINNAGVIQDFIPLADLQDSAIERQMNINFYGMMNMTRAFIPYLAERGEACIGNVSSMGGFLPVPGQAVYGASKAAVKIATEGLRMELSRTGIGVSLIIPGGVETDIKKNSGLENAEVSEAAKKSAGIKLTSLGKAADIILGGMERNKAKILIGTDCRIMDFLYRLMPLKAGEMISKVMSANHGGIFNRAEQLAARI
ncbi:MAG: short-chain dehydrogenase [Spirochaetae bacterium HGW-Spirochaetae-3]|jgi:short-subunit dehydrogenase|nr:MAG: short-chain dehydrogenase [Spirochaetae bacterium HGW-Spirochaetae-3]